MNKIELKGNLNYCATVVEIKNIVKLENCDNVVATIIMGNHVIVGNDVNIGDIGLFFPVETQLSKKYLSSNSLYRDPTNNKDVTKKGYFEENGRIKCAKFRGHNSEGLFMPISSLNALNVEYTEEEFPIGTEFDLVNGTTICNKYILKNNKEPGTGGGRKDKLPKISKLVDNQFRFHLDTEQLFRNLDRIHPNDIIQNSYKIHGTSAISSKILCKKDLKWYEKILKGLGVNIVDTAYNNIYSSRKTVKNDDLRPNANHFYKEDIWGIGNKELLEFLQDGMTIYYEIAGFLPSGGYIQGSFDYGCEPNKHKLFIYRITYTTPTGKVFEFSAKQVQDFCNENGLTPVPQLFYGYAKDFYVLPWGSISPIVDNEEEYLKLWREGFLQEVKSRYNEKNCYICNNKVPEEGAVVRVEKNKFTAFKCKSVRFLEYETKMIDKGEVDIENEN